MLGISGAYSCRDDRLPAGSFGEWYGGAIVGDAGCTKSSSSIRMTVIRNLSPGSRHRALPASSIIISHAAGHRLRGASCHDAAMMDVININRSENDRVQSIRDRVQQVAITRFYIKLLCIPEGAAKIVSLARFGSYEVRMLESLQKDSDAAPLFSIELFDHDAQLPVDSCSCFDIDEGAAAFRTFISR